MHRKPLSVLLMVCLAVTLLFPAVVSAESMPAFKHTDWAFNADYTKVTVDGKTYDNYIIAERLNDGTVIVSNFGMWYLSDPWNQERMSVDEFFGKRIKNSIKGSIEGIESVFPNSELLEINWKPWQETEFSSHNIEQFQTFKSDDPNYDWNELESYLKNTNANGSAYDHYSKKMSIEDSVSRNPYKNAPIEMIGTYKTSKEFFDNNGNFENSGKITKYSYSELQAAINRNVAETPSVPSQRPTAGVESNLYIDKTVMEKIQNDVTQQITLDAPPYLSASGNTMVPVRAVADCFGISVAWDPATQQVKLDNNRIVLAIGSNQAMVAGTPKSLAEGPTIVNGRTFVPLRFVSEVLGYQVEWKAETKGIRISK